MKLRDLPPFIGIRIKPLTAELTARSLRTLELFLTTLAGRTGGALPANFTVTLTKITVPEQVAALVATLEALEQRHSLPAIPIELMIETPQSMIGPRGELALPALVAAARGRCRGAHFGIYDFTASLDITATHQAPSHPVCEFARHAMQVALAGTGITLSDGSTMLMPVGPHRAAPGGPPLSAAQQDENRRAVHRAWKAHYDDVRSSMRQGYYQGWDLHPAQLPTRYAAVFAFFLEAREEASARLRNFLDKAAQATRIGSVFDDAATGQGLLGFFLRGLSSGALTEDEALATGLTLEELRGRSFLKILNARRGR
jgi:citrate lyase beta subunit